MMPRRIKVLALMEATDFGGPAANLVATARLLRDRVETEVVAFLRGNRESSAFIRRVREAGLSVHVIRERRRYDPAALCRLARTVNAAQADILQVHNTKSRLLLSLLRLGRRIDRRTSRLDFFHGETWVDARQHLYNRLDRLLFRFSPCVVAVSAYQRDLLVSWGLRPERISIVHNAIVPAPVLPSLPVATGDRFAILAVGRLSAEKGHIVLVRALQRLAALYPRLSLTIVGGGKEEKGLRECIAENNLQQKVELAGHQEDPSPFYRKAGLFVLPSLSEGLPNVLLEAAMHEVPIIAFAVGGVAEVVQDGVHARLLSDKSPEALAGAIAEFIEQPERFREMARRAKARVLDEFGMARRAERLAALYRTLVPSPPERA